MLLSRSSFIPNNNVEVFRLLYLIEVGLREFIIVKLTSIYGTRWYKQGLPGDVLSKYKDAKTSEKKTSWINDVPLDPIYYIDFPDLAKVIQGNKNWNTAFGLSETTKDVLVNTLKEIEPIRNKIAHNRKATSADLKLIEAAYTKISSVVGEEQFLLLVNKCTDASDLPSTLDALYGEAEVALKASERFELLPKLVIWLSIFRKWWYDEEYLGIDLTPINLLFSTFDEYNKLPRYRGSGVLIEEWIQKQNLSQKFIEAEKIFRLLKEAYS